MWASAIAQETLRSADNFGWRVTSTIAGRDREARMDAGDQNRVDLCFLALQGSRLPRFIPLGFLIAQLGALAFAFASRVWHCQLGDLDPLYR